MVALLVGRHAVFNIAAGGISLDPMKDRTRQARFVARLHGVCHHRQGGQARIGDEQRARHAKFAAPFGQFFHATRADLDGSRVVPVNAGHGHGSVPEDILDQTVRRWKDLAWVSCS
ncbi:hypothetical protein D3C71_1258030 [compost metagenome]